MRCHRSDSVARVERIIPQANEVRKTLPVILALTDFVPNLSDGIDCDHQYRPATTPDALTIPASALLEPTDTSATLFTVNDYNKLEARAVKLGIRGEEIRRRYG